MRLVPNVEEWRIIVIYSILFTGKFEENSSHDAVVLLEKTPFSETTLPQMLSKESSLVREFNNDIYSRHEISVF